MKGALCCAVFALVCAYAQAQCCLGFGLSVDGSTPWPPIPTTVSTCAAIVGVTSPGGAGAGVFVTDCPKFCVGHGVCSTLFHHHIRLPGSLIQISR